MPSTILHEVPIDQVKPYENNPRRNADKAIKAVAKSIEKYGYQSPIVVDENMVLLAGDKRFKAMSRLKWKTIPFLVKAEGLTEEKKKMFRIMDNRTNEIAGWDLELTAKEIEAAGGDLDFSDLLKQFLGETDDGRSAPVYPIEARFSEKYDGVVVISENEIDFAWLENFLGLERKQSYKSGKVGVTRVITVKALQDIIEKLRKAK